MDVESGALEHGGADRLADVVDVALDGSHDGGSLDIRSLLSCGELVVEGLHSFLHSGRGRQDVRQEELPPLEKDTDLGHAPAEGVDDLGGGHACGVGLVDSFGYFRYFARDKSVVQFLGLILECHF